MTTRIHACTSGPYVVLELSTGVRLTLAPDAAHKLANDLLQAQGAALVWLRAAGPDTWREVVEMVDGKGQG